MTDQVPEMEFSGTWNQPKNTHFSMALQKPGFRVPDPSLIDVIFCGQVYGILLYGFDISDLKYHDGCT